jgi:hypothetical protein
MDAIARVAMMRFGFEREENSPSVDLISKWTDKIFEWVFVVIRQLKGTV